jgi:hypothetical protein
VQHCPRVAGGVGAGDDNPTRSVAVSREAVVIRFRPTQVESVLSHALVEHRLSGRAGLSVFADVAGDNEDRDALLTRLLGVSELAGLDPGKNQKFWLCSTAAELVDEGFVFYKDEDDDELPEHFSIDLGGAPSSTKVELFLGHFGPEGGMRR